MTDVVEPCHVRDALLWQWSLAWSFADDFIIGQIDNDLATWQPAPSSWTVHPTPGGWRADWADDEEDGIPAPASAGWILWHIQWWLSNTIAAVRGDAQIQPTEFIVKTGTDNLVRLHHQWEEILLSENLDQPVKRVLPEAQPLATVAAWVNAELWKNLAEIGQLKMLYAHKDAH